MHKKTPKTIWSCPKSVFLMTSVVCLCVYHEPIKCTYCSTTSSVWPRSSQSCAVISSTPLAFCFIVEISVCWTLELHQHALCSHFDKQSIPCWVTMSRSVFLIAADWCTWDWLTKRNDNGQFYSLVLSFNYAHVPKIELLHFYLQSKNALNPV